MIEWLKKSNRWKHLLGGFIVGLFAGNLYAAGYSALVAGACLEFKDRAYGGKWDWIDLFITFLGGIFGGLPAFFFCEKRAKRVPNTTFRWSYRWQQC